MMYRRGRMESMGVLRRDERGGVGLVRCEGRYCQGRKWVEGRDVKGFYPGSRIMQGGEGWGKGMEGGGGGERGEGGEEGEGEEGGGGEEGRNRD